MTKPIIKACLLGLMVAGITGTSAQLRAQDTNNVTIEKKQPKPKKVSGIVPFHGKLKAVDNTAKTITVGDLTIQITSETKIDKADKPMMLQDGVVGETVSGAYKKAEDGKLTATMLHLGPKESKKHPKKNATSD